MILHCFQSTTQNAETLFFSFHSEDEDPEYKPLRMPFKDDLDDLTNSPMEIKDEAGDCDSEGKPPLGK